MTAEPITVVYHQEPEGWWAEAPDVEGFVASGETLAEVRGLVREGLPFYLDSDEIEIAEVQGHDGLVLDLKVNIPALTAAVWPADATSKGGSGVAGVLQSAPLIKTPMRA